MIPSSTVNSCRIPMIGLGTYRVRGQECYDAVTTAIRLGYRHIDTASVYRNEEQVGRAIRDLIQEGFVTRAELFVTSKIAPKDHGEERAHEAVKESLAKLGLDKLDLMLIHWPAISGHPPSSEIHQSIRLGTWRALERHVRQGTVAHIGVSNYTLSHLTQLAANCSIKPAALQVEIHPWYIPQAEIDWCAANNVVVVAYSSLGEGKLVDPELEFEEADGPARRLCVPRAQVLLAWARMHGWVALPKARSEERMRINLESVHVELTSNEVEALDRVAREKNHKFCWDPAKVA